MISHQYKLTTHPKAPFIARKALVLRLDVSPVIWFGAEDTCAPRQRTGYAKKVPNLIFILEIPLVLSLPHICGPK
jgi:hypothetical protein